MVNLGLTTIIIIIFFAIPTYFVITFLNLFRVKFTSTLGVFLSKEMLLLGPLCFLPAYPLAHIVFSQLSFEEISPYSPLRWIINSSQSSVTPDHRIKAWLFFIGVFVMTSFIVSFLIALLLKYLLLKTNTALFRRLVSSLGWWDPTSQLLALGAEKRIIIDLAHDDKGETVFTGELVDTIETGGFQGIVLTNVYMTKFAAGGTKIVNYKNGDSGILKMMIFMRDKVKNIHIRSDEPKRQRMSPDSSDFKELKSVLANYGSHGSE